MGKIITIAETAAWLKERDNFLIITHRRPDGDTIGCAGALAEGLRMAGKTAYVLYDPEVTPRYSPFVETYWAPEGYSHDFVIVVDTAAASLIPTSGEAYVGAVSLCIDHHPSNPGYAELTCLIETATCGEVIYAILLELTGCINEKCAGCLYAAVSTDTGCFVFANTTAEAHRVAAELIKAGAPHKKLNKLLFRTKTRSRIMIEGMINSGLEFYFDGAVAISTITREMMAAAGADEDDVDDIASLPGSIEGVLAGITIRELTSTEDCKISVRTSQPVSAHQICACFGGGGHALAAGCSMEKTVTEVKKALLEVLPDFIPGAARS